MKKIYSTIVLAVATLPAFTQLDSTKLLEEVVVTGQYKPQSVKNSVYQVRVINKDRIQKQGASKLQDVLNTELNIRFSQDLATGGSDITMMGLKGQNVKILVDGMPMVGRQGTSNEININQIDINSIERIEIIEGPMSVIYGADALAGVINIITKKTSAAKFSVTAKLQEETVGKEYGVQQGVHTQYVGATWRHKNLDVGGGFGYNYFGGWKGDSLFRELAWHWKDQIIGNGYIGYTTSKFNIRYRIDGLDEIITNPANFKDYRRDAGDSIAHDQEYLSRRVMHQVQAGYFANANLSFQIQAAYTDFRRQVFSTVLSQNTGKLSMDPAPGSQSLDKFTGFTFRGTALYRISSFATLQPGVDINLESGEGQRLKSGNNEINDYAFFITSELTPSDRISIRPGLRLIKNSVYDAPPVIPSINAKIVVAKNLDLRLSYANGFRAPSLRELYYNFFDANHQLIGNPDLKAETSNSYTGSFTWKKVTRGHVAYTTILGAFYNDVKNLIGFAESPSDPNVFMMTNISKSKTAGVNLSTIAKYKQLNVTVGASYTGFYNDYSEEDKSLPQLQWSPEVNTNIGYAFSKIGLDVNLFYKLTGKQPSYILKNSEFLITKLKGYQIADLTLNKKLFRYFSINAGIKNLFDVDLVNSTVQATSGGAHATTTGGRNVAYGRSYFAGLTFNWDKK